MITDARGAMKICFFHLMPYRFLPEDFENRYRSVWVDVPHHLYDPEKTRGLYHEFLDELEFAEARSEEHTSELQSRLHLVCRLLLEKKKKRPPHLAGARDSKSPARVQCNRPLP